jgi:hypothetical protein
MRANIDRMSGTGDAFSADDRFRVALTGLCIGQLGGMAVTGLLGLQESGGAVLLLVVLSALPTAGLVYIDLRGFRRADRWQPPLRGALWVLASALPLLNPSILVAYLIRRRERVTRTRFDRWHWVAGAGVAVLIVFMIVAGARGDTTTTADTPFLDAAAFTLIATTLLPPLGGYFDVGYVADRVPNRSARERFVWPYLFGIWVLNIPMLAIYLYRRRQSLGSVSDAETMLSERLSDADDRLAAAESGVDEGAFDRAADALDDADAHLTSAETAAERLDREGAAGSIADRRERLDALRPRAEHGEQLAEAERRARELAYVAEQGRAALEDGSFRDAADAFIEAERGLGVAAETIPDGIDPSVLDIDGDLEGSRRAAAAGRDRALDRLAVERAAPLADRVAALVADIDHALEEGDLERAGRLLDEARDNHGALVELREEYDLDIEPAVGEDTLAARRATLDRHRRAARVSQRLETADRRETDGREAMDADEYERAESAFRDAREAVDDAATLVEQHDLTDEFDDLDDRRSTLDGLLGSTARERRRDSYRDALERGDERLEDAREAADDDAYETAFAACDDASEAYQAARTIATEHETGDAEAVEERLDELATVRTELELGRLSARVTDSRDAVADLAEQDAAPEAYEAVAADCRDLIDTIDGLDLGRERDLAVLRREAGRELVHARAAAARQRADDAAASFDDGAYAAARDAFEAVAESVDDIRDTADELGVDPDIDLNRLRTVCSSNADAARRAVLGIEDAPDRRSLTGGDGPPSSDTTTPADTTDPVTATDGARASGATPPNDGVADRLRDELPDHEVLAFVGSGGNADVHRVRLDTGHVAALKVPRWDGTLSRDVVERFTREAETWAKLDDHDHIVPVLDWGRQPYPWLLLEYLDASLADRADDLTIPMSIDVLTGVCDALEFAHGRGVVHLDVKPENVLLTETNVPKVGDWGLARVLLDHSHTQLGLTPAYSAPEQLTEEYGDVDRRTDVYQASVLGYRLLTGRLPFEADRPTDLQRAILSGTPTPPSEHHGDLPSAVDDVLLRGMARDPDDRYETAVLLRNALSGIN